MGIRQRILLGVVGLGIAAGAWAGEEAVVTRDDLTKRESSLEHSRAGKAALATTVSAEAPEAVAPESLVTMRKRGCLFLGGDVGVVAAVMRRDEGVPRATDKGVHTVNSTTFATDSAALTFGMMAGSNASLKIRINLDDATGDEHLEDVHFLFTDIAGTPWAMAVGKQTVEYGMGYSVGITPTLQGGSSLYFSGVEPYYDAEHPHVQVGTNDFPGARPGNELTFALGYDLGDLGWLYGAVFQNRIARGMHEDRSDDHLGLQSFALKANLHPLERLNVQLSLINFHFDSLADGEARFARGSILDPDDAVADQTAASVGFSYGFASVPVKMFGEYQHGWNWRYNDRVSADTASLGAAIKINDPMYVGLQAEWARLDEAPGYDREEYTQAFANINYRFPNNVKMTLEYAHAWYEGCPGSGGEVDRHADVVAFRTEFSF